MIGSILYSLTLDGKAALVTGASGGIGAAIALANKLARITWAMLNKQTRYQAA